METVLVHRADGVVTVSINRPDKKNAATWATWQALTQAVREVTETRSDRVLVITWWDAGLDAELPELPEPGPELAGRAVHRWRFESVDSD